METSLLRKCAAAAFALPLLPALADQVTPPAPLGKPAASAYRQLTPDGRVLYSDKPIKGAKVQEEIVPPPRGVVSLDESKHKKPLQIEHRPVAKVAEIPGVAQRKSLDEANSEVIRAEMLLEDARRRQLAGEQPRPGELTADGGNSRPNAAYVQRQQTLARDVAQAEAMLRQARTERDALQRRH